MAKGITMSETLTAVEGIALDKIKGKKSDIEAGDHTVDFIVRVKGTVRKGEDFDKTPTASIPTVKALALMVKRMGCTRDAAIKKLMEAMTDAINGETAVEIDEWLTEAEAKVREGLAALPKTRCSGSVTTVDMVCEKLDVLADVMAVRA